MQLEAENLCISVFLEDHRGATNSNQLEFNRLGADFRVFARCPFIAKDSNWNRYG